MPEGKTCPAGHTQEQDAPDSPPPAPGPALHSSGPHTGARTLTSGDNPTAGDSHSSQLSPALLTNQLTGSLPSVFGFSDLLGLLADPETYHRLLH